VLTAAKERYHKSLRFFKLRNALANPVRDGSRAHCCKMQMTHGDLCHLTGALNSFFPVSYTPVREMIDKRPLQHCTSLC